MIESLIVLVFLLAAFYFLYDFAYAAVARTLLENGAASAARADAVGFNDFQQAKSLRVGMIPVSGRRLVPDELDQLQGFPKGWTDTGMTDGPRAFCMGNALIVGIPHRIGEVIARRLG